MNCQATRFVVFVLLLLCVSTNVFPMLCLTQRNLMQKSLAHFVMPKVVTVFKRYCSTKNPDSDITKLILRQNEKLFKQNQEFNKNALRELETIKKTIFHSIGFVVCLGLGNYVRVLCFR